VASSAIDTITKNRRHRQDRRADRLADAVPHLAGDGLLFRAGDEQSTATTSSNEVTKANKAPGDHARQDQGHDHLEKRRRGGWRPSACCRPDQRLIETAERVAVTVMITKGMPSVAWAIDHPQMRVCKVSRPQRPPNPIALSASRLGVEKAQARGDDDDRHDHRADQDAP
jgi:hypothetical protein